MSDPYKVSRLEWAGLIITVLGSVGTVFLIRAMKPLPANTPALVIGGYVLLMFVPIFIGIILLLIGSFTRSEKLWQIKARRTAETNAWLDSIKKQYPPSDDVLHHLHQLGYHNVYRYVSELKSALQWVAANYKATLASKPVRDADECLSRADYLTRK